MKSNLILFILVLFLFSCNNENNNIKQNNENNNITEISENDNDITILSPLDMAKYSLSDSLIFSF